MEISRGHDQCHSIESLLDETNSLVSMPDVCFKLREVIASDSHSREDIVNIIVHDPALTTRLLRVVNSAFYGLGRPVRDISHALSILGEYELNNLVIVTSIVNSVKSNTSKQPHMNINYYWRSSIYSAVMASELAKHTKCAAENIEEFFISGLLLNIGKLLIYHNEPELLNFVEQEMRDSGRPDFEIEKEQLGFDHADVGAVMAKSWNFSEHLTESITAHHQCYSDKNSILQNIMILTAYSSDQLDFSCPKQISAEDPEISEAGLMEKLQLSHEQYFAIVYNTNEGYSMAFEAFCGVQT